MSASCPSQRTARKTVDNGFSLIELLLVIALLALLTAVLAPALGKPKTKSQQQTCLNNLRQLGLGWILYSGDNADKIVRTGGLDQLVSDPTAPDGLPGGPKSQWALGNVAILPDATNTLLLRAGLLYPYVKHPGVYKCPADRHTLGSLPTVRSISINCWMNPIRDWNTIMGYEGRREMRVFRKQTDVQAAAPARLWVLIDESSRTLNDGWFVCDPNATAAWRDLPASYHQGGAGLAFADGHSELRKWLNPPIAFPKPAAAPAAPDLSWLQERSTLRHSANF